MTHRLASLTFLLAAVATVAAQQPVSPAAIAGARAEIDRLATAANAEVSVVWRPLDARPGEELLIGPTVRFHAASTMKVPVMIELFAQAQAGRSQARRRRPRHQQLPQHRRRQPVRAVGERGLRRRDLQGDRQEAEPARAVRDDDHGVRQSGRQRPRSSGWARRTSRRPTDRLGAGGMQVLRGVEDQKAFDKGLNNTTDAAALATLFEQARRAARSSSRAGERRDDRDPQAPEAQRGHSGRTAGGHRRRAQDGRDHAHPSRRRRSCTRSGRTCSSCSCAGSTTRRRADD